MSSIFRYLLTISTKCDIVFINFCIFFIPLRLRGNGLLKFSAKVILIVKIHIHHWNCQLNNTLYAWVTYIMLFSDGLNELKSQKEDRQ